MATTVKGVAMGDMTDDTVRPGAVAYDREDDGLPSETDDWDQRNQQEQRSRDARAGRNGRHSARRVGDHGTGRRTRRRRDVTYHAGRRPGSASRTAAVLALLCGLAAIACGAASAAHEIAPAYLDPDGKIPGRLIAESCAALIVVTLVLVIVARATVPRRTSRRGVASGGIVSFVFAAMLLALGVVVGVLFPDGLIAPAVRDEAPVNSDDGMRFGIERVTGKCTSGWKDVDVNSYPGVSSAAACVDTRVAYMTFDSATTADLYRGVVSSKIASLLDEHASDARAKGDWRTLSGSRWLVFGSKENMTALEKEWGGTIAVVDTSRSDGAKNGTTGGEGSAS